MKYTAFLTFALFASANVAIADDEASQKPKGTEIAKIETDPAGVVEVPRPIEPTESWTERMAMQFGDRFYSALYYLPATSDVFKKEIGEEEELWIGFDQTYWPNYDDNKRHAIRKACAARIDQDELAHAHQIRNRVERWIAASHRMESNPDLYVEQILTVAYTLPQTTAAFDWVFERREELKRGQTDPRIMGSTLTSAEMTYFMGLLFNEMSKMTDTEMSDYTGKFYRQLEAMFPKENLNNAVASAG